MSKKIRTTTSKGTRHLKSKEGLAEQSSEQMPPVFSFEHLQKSHCISLIEEKADKAIFLDALHVISKMSWSQINSAPRHGLGYERLPADQIKASKPACVTGDVNLLVFRWKGKLPYVGFRDGRVLHVLWIERQFGGLYNHS